MHFVPLSGSVGALGAILRTPQPKYFRGISARDSERHSSCAAHFQRDIALLVAHRSLQRKDDDLFAQAGNQDRWPIFMIADLHCENVAWPEVVDLVRKIASTCFDLVEGAQ